MQVAPVWRRRLVSDVSAPPGAATSPGASYTGALPCRRRQRGWSTNSFRIDRLVAVRREAAELYRRVPLHGLQPLNALSLAISFRWPFARLVTWRTVATLHAEGYSVAAPR